MSNKILNLTPELSDYLQAVSLREPEVLAQLRAETAEHPMAQMQICPEQGQFMALLIRLLGAKKILEIGVFTGYSSLAVALALPDDGKLIACDTDAEVTNIARQYWEMAGVSDKIELHLAPALQTLEMLCDRNEQNTFDFVFIDADKRNYRNYYNLALELVRPGGIIAVDNVLWSGRVADNSVQDPRTQAIRDFNQMLHDDDRIHLSLLPIGDGLTLAMKK